ncbi:MAG: tol-pal system-associated acyl-CoA thioesterase [Nitrosomonadales bacterium]|jgi:acyl-CoA thioester hydrolase|nr:tol-pal system-associated acyl-CoA thioesterase [Nitrosomonadales bacterium]MBT5150105.1 tol-pal system-associated acyl-CoA thioesterase [Nitrosomonadales bacterium]MBT6014982.1 tol-pal system-associated acyl-CoA thioesterase [Nitrosomonadales bacterium]MBT7120459.1 tol-pal system-associated acyl-CoA thioesterase [Nitrosomonadales bacterium]
MVALFSFKWPVRIYFEDTDSGGVVYHSNYLKFMERARTEWLRSLNLNQSTLKKKDKIMFVVAKVDINYKKAARFNDELDVVTTVDNIGASKVNLTQNIMKNSELYTSAKVSIACIHTDTFKPQRIPKLIKQQMEIL